MKSTATFLLIFFSLLTIQPLISLAAFSVQKEVETCNIPPCCNHHKEKKAPKPLKGMCGEMSCNPFGQYSCCTGFIVSHKTIFSFVPEKIWESKSLFTQSYTSNFACDCWRPPENTVTTLA